MILLLFLTSTKVCYINTFAKAVNLPSDNNTHIKSPKNPHQNASIV